MANEVTASGLLAYSDSDRTTDFIDVVAKQATVASKKILKGKFSAATTETAVPLAPVTAPGWVFIKNLDATNFVNLKTGTGGVVFAKLLPGEFALLRLGSGAQSPYAQADTAACSMEILICQT